MSNLQINSQFKEEFHNICQKWFQDIDEELCKNLNQLTCNDIHDFYYTFFKELKKWRSNSGNFTGFSELLLFRTLYRLIGEQFKPTGTGDSKDFVRFESENYEIGQSARLKVNGKNKYPDIYVKRNNQLISVISIKICIVDEATIDNEIRTFESFKSEHPMIKGLLIVFVKSDLSKGREEKLRNAGFEPPLVLQENNTLICDVLRRLI